LNNQDAVSKFISFVSKISQSIKQSVSNLQRYRILCRVLPFISVSLPWPSWSAQQWNDVEVFDLECCLRGAIRGRKRDSVRILLFVSSLCLHGDKIRRNYSTLYLVLYRRLCHSVGVYWYLSAQSDLCAKYINTGFRTHSDLYFLATSRIALPYHCFTWPSPHRIHRLCTTKLVKGWSNRRCDRSTCRLRLQVNLSVLVHRKSTRSMIYLWYF